MRREETYQLSHAALPRSFFRKMLNNSFMTTVGIPAMQRRSFSWVKAADISAPADRSADFVHHKML
jgi:hypothetical protein